MAPYEYLILGGGIAGVSAAESIRARYARGRIGIISDEPHLLYSRVLLPSYLKRRVERNRLFLRTADDFSEKGIDLWLGQEAVGLDVEARSVLLKSGNRISFENLLITTGGTPNVWGEEKDAQWVYRLQTLDDADRLHNDLGHITRPVVIGSSFIALEFLEICLSASIQPTLLAKDPHFFAHLIDSQGGELFEENFKTHDVAMIFQDTAVRMSVSLASLSSHSEYTDVKNDQGLPFIIETQEKEKIAADAVMVGIGLNRTKGFLKDAGIQWGEKGILTNEFFETNLKGIFAAGDVAEFYDVIRESHHVDGNWTSAFLQGRHAGLVMAGDKKLYKNVSAYSITNLGFQITALGDVTSAAEAIVRIDFAKKQYERFFVHDGVLQGAVLVNHFSDKPHLARLIETRTPIAAHTKKLEDMSFDVQKIEVVK